MARYDMGDAHSMVTLNLFFNVSDILQEHPDTLLSLEYRPVWYRRAASGGGGVGGGGGASSRSVSVWRPMGPPGYVSLGDVAVVSVGHGINGVEPSICVELMVWIP